MQPIKKWFMNNIYYLLFGLGIGLLLAVPLSLLFGSVLLGLAVGFISSALSMIIGFIIAQTIRVYA